MGLEPLEFSECLTDSPHFRDKLHAHEKELKKTSKAIKGLIGECKDLLQATSNLSKAQRSFAKTLANFHCESVVGQQTEDEIIIEESTSEFGKLMDVIEEERDRMLEQANASVIQPLEKFRKELIDKAKDQKRKYAKEVEKFSQLLEKSLSLKQSKASDTQIAETDYLLTCQRFRYLNEAMEYVQLLQEIEERKKFEFVEILLQFTSGLLTFYHQGYEVASDFNAYKQDLSLKLQKCRDNFESTKDATRHLMSKMLKNPLEHRAMCQQFTREGYLLLQEKKAFSSSWVRVYCQFRKAEKTLLMTSSNLLTGKSSSSETIVISNCTRRASDSIDRRFCFDVTLTERSSSLTFQALSEEDLNLWMDALDGKEPIYATFTPPNKTDSLLNKAGFSFLKRCIEYVEEKGLEEVGLYRVVGASSLVTKLTSYCNDEQKAKDFVFGEEYDTKAVTSAIKAYCRSLPEPLTTYALYDSFIAAAKMDSKTPESRAARNRAIHRLVLQLPKPNFEILELLVAHLQRVSRDSAKNMMTVSNLGVCFGPTLMWPKDESVAAFLDIKFASLVVEIFIEECDVIFKTPSSPSTAAANGKAVLNLYSTVSDRPAQLQQPPRVPPKPSCTKRVAPALPAKTLHPNTVPGSQMMSALPTGNRSPNVARKTVWEKPTIGRTAKAQYDCQADNDSEVSFKKHQIILDVRPSDEAGWVYGTVDGKTGLIPENYIWIL